MSIQFLDNKHQSVGFCGSRQPGLEASGLISEVLKEVLMAASAVHVGCCVGVDAMVLSSVIQARAFSSCQVFSAFGPDGQGSCSVSAIDLVSRFHENGGLVHWFSGGSCNTRLSFRLAGRTKALVHSVSSLFAFVGTSKTNRSGTWLAIKLAQARGLSVIVFPVRSFSFPSLGQGHWEIAGDGVWAKGFKWVSNQMGLF